MSNMSDWAKRSAGFLHGQLERLEMSESKAVLWLRSSSWQDPTWKWVARVLLLGLVYLALSHVAAMWQQVVQLGVLIMAGFATEGILKAVQNYKPRKTIPEVAGKAVFITGCDSGFGLALAGRLLDLGFTVYAGCMDPSGAGPASLSLQKGRLGRVRPLRCDVTSELEVAASQRQVVAEMATAGERLWAVVNNAGVAACTEIEWCSLEEFRRHLDVNALGTVCVTKAFVPLLREQGGRVVIVASLAGRYTFPGFTAYSMSKHAVVSFADGLRLEMEKWGISVHTVEPTLYRTSITDSTSLQSHLDGLWSSCPAEVQDSYGRQYFLDFKQHLTEHLNKAKPRECVVEVVADMVDAVCGTEPQPRYVPSVQTQLKCRLLSSLPVDVRHHLLLKGSPSTPPALVATMRKPHLTDPRISDLRVKPALKRHFSVPNPEKRSPTPPPNPRAHLGSPKFIFGEE